MRGKQATPPIGPGFIYDHQIHRLAYWKILVADHLESWLRPNMEDSLTRRQTTRGLFAFVTRAGTAATLGQCPLRRPSTLSASIDGVLFNLRF